MEITKTLRIPYPLSRIPYLIPFVYNSFRIYIYFMKNKSNSDYRAPVVLPGGHLQTIYPSLFRNQDHNLYERELITTPDDDFLYLDWSSVESEKLAIISHSLEGSSHRPYLVGRPPWLVGWFPLLPDTRPRCQFRARPCFHQ